jgi:hypothetical protein
MLIEFPLEETLTAGASKACQAMNEIGYNCTALHAHSPVFTVTIRRRDGALCDVTDAMRFGLLLARELADPAAVDQALTAIRERTIFVRGLLVN